MTMNISAMPAFNRVDASTQSAAAPAVAAAAAAPMRSLENHPLSACPGGRCSNAQFSAPASAQEAAPGSDSSELQGLDAKKRREVELNDERERQNRVMMRLMSDAKALTERSKNEDDRYVQTVKHASQTVH